MLHLYATLHTLGLKAGEGLRRRAQGDAGQTAAEYMGIIVIIVAIVVAIKGLNLDQTISQAITTAITKITS
jgi:pilus assembly protein Flp/PilA